jgi:23S rRNA pseudouridine2605 synthase
MHPRFGIEKTYLVQVQGEPSKGDLEQLLRGVWLAEGKVRTRRVRRLKKQGESTWLRIVLAEGKNREIRRMLARLGHKVLSLKREAIGPVRLDRLPKGKARRLSGMELQALKQAVARRSAKHQSGGTTSEAGSNDVA